MTQGENREQQETARKYERNKDGAELKKGQHGTLSTCVSRMCEDTVKYQRSAAAYKDLQWRVTHKEMYGDTA